MQKVVMGGRCLGILWVLVFAGTALRAQEVQWASELFSFSSQKASIRYSAKQVLGKPNKMPARGESPCAWAGKYDGEMGGSEEKLKVGFKKPMQIQQVAIAENLAPGAVEKVILYDIDGKAYPIYHGEVGGVSVPSRVFSVTFARTPYKVKAVELIMQCGKVRGLNQIDAIGIADTKTSVKITPNIAKESTQIGKRENVGRGVNSQIAEVYPIISPDGKTLFFDRKGHPQNIRKTNIGSDDNIWVSELSANGECGVAQNIGRTLNGGFGNFVASVTPDGNTLLLGGNYPIDNTPTFGVWTSTREINGWSKPTKVQIKNFYTKNKFVEFCLANDGKTMIFSLQRDDSNEDRDLYMSSLLPDGTWTEPKNLGSTINSLADEGMPFLAADGKTVYFGSNGFSGYGEKDIYLARRLDETWTKWSEPENLGPVLNTVGWDTYFTLPASGEYAYFVSGEGSFGQEDIFRAKLPPALRPEPVVLVSGKVYDKKTGKPLAASIRYEILPSGKEVGIARSNPRTGEYKIVLPAGSLYGFRAEADNYLAINENLDLAKSKEYKEATRDLFLVPYEVGEKILINNIFFEFGKADLRPESNAELNRLADFIRSSSEMELEVAGHTDNVGSPEKNLTLSQQRAKAVRDYLLLKGVEAKQLKSVGFGMTKPIASNSTEAGRQQNRRVEFTILKR
jgi:OmpA-OmpF porin, OOP family